MARIGRVSYRTGFVERLREASRLPAITIEAADLPEDVFALLDHHHLDLGDTYGDPEAGDPFSTTSYASSMPRALSRSSSTTAPSCCSRPTTRWRGGFTGCAGGLMTSPPHKGTGRQVEIPAPRGFAARGLPATRPPAATQLPRPHTSMGREKDPATSGFTLRRGR